jgi:hypothetical protein
MYKKAKTLKVIDTANKVIDKTNKSCTTVADLKSQLKKILDHYSKDLELYLQCAEYPIKVIGGNDTTGNGLFTREEVKEFIDEQRMLPLEKLVILSGIMNKCLTLKFTGKRTASIPLLFTGNPDDFLAQLHLNIYTVIAILDCSAPEHFDATEKGSPESNFAVDLNQLKRQVVDLRSFDAIVTAASYRGFAVRVEMRNS